MPTKSPQLGKTTYEMILNHFLLNDKPVSCFAQLCRHKACDPPADKQQLLATINKWPADIYDLRSIMADVQSELDAVRTDTVLLEVMGEL